MPRETSPYIVGDYWLDKRRDGKSPDIWQITYYKPATRQVVYRSTHTGALDVAKAKLHAFDEMQRAKGRQQPDEAKVIPLLVTYWDERGHALVNAEQCDLSLRMFTAFLLQDEVGVNAVLTDMTPVLFERFRAWRMAPHSIDLTWRGKHYSRSYQPVVGATVQRHINDIRAALYHAEGNGRVNVPFKIRDLEDRYKSTHTERILTLHEMGQIFWYSRHFPDLFRFVALQMATSVRPMAALQFDPRKQFNGKLIDLQPDTAPQTKKRNAIIPAIRPLRPILSQWAKEGAVTVKSRKTRWRKMRANLGLSNDVQPKTIRYTIATWVYEMDWVPGRQISAMLGHDADPDDVRRTSRIYAKYRPDQLGKVVKALSIVWLRVSREAKKISAVQRLSTDPWHGKITVARKSQND